MIPALAASGLALALALTAAWPAGGRPHATRKPSSPRFEVGEIVVRFVDHSRRVTYPGQRPRPRTLETVIRYPATGNPSGNDVRNAPPATAAGPFPLIVFGHGFAVTPTTYTNLLRAWARAGFVVAAPYFPLTNANTPGGPRESDLVNQPRDMSFVITRVLAAGAAHRGTLAGLVNPREVAVSGQSDGGSTALAVAGNEHYFDRRVGAAMILSGAEIPGVSGYDFPAPNPKFLAAQGTADPLNIPPSTYSWFRLAPRPKFLLSLLGAGHLPPYTDQQPQLSVVERETIAFLERYLEHRPNAKARMWKDGDVPGVAQLSIRAP